MQSENGGQHLGGGLFFARSLQEKVWVPIGILESDWGGTPPKRGWGRISSARVPDYEIEIMGEWAQASDNYNRNLAAYEAAQRQAKATNTEFTNRPPGRPWKPAELYNGMIAPLLPFAIEGAIWYQGESNAGSPHRAMQYHKLFPDLIRDWRSAWGEGEFRSCWCN